MACSSLRWMSLNPFPGLTLPNWNGGLQRVDDLAPYELRNGQDVLTASDPGGEVFLVARDAPGRVPLGMQQDGEVVDGGCRGQVARQGNDVGFVIEVMAAATTG